MIISASYKTDIPTFYSRWFLNRIRAGYCRMVNPFNRTQHYKVALTPDSVDGFVFWTKNVGPFLGVLREVEAIRIPFIIQYTINSYPRELEARVVDSSSAITHMKELAAHHGSLVAVWRYDTIIFSSITDYDFHCRNFESLARRLEGYTDEVVISFMQLYQKTKRNMNQAAADNTFRWWDPDLSQKTKMLRELVSIARSYGMTPTVCGQPEFLGVPGAEEARCVDAPRLWEIGGKKFKAKLKGGRKSCGCYESKDIGDYDTCPHGCVYCYAVRNRTLALKRFKAHDPQGEYLFPPGVQAVQVDVRNPQLSLFSEES